MGPQPHELRAGAPRISSEIDGLYVERRAGAAALAPVVFVHGVLDSARSFGRVVRALDPARAVVAYDRRGYQRSRDAAVTTAVTTTPFARHVADLIGVLEQARGADEHPRPVVLGHSYGGVVALAAAVERPELVGGVLAYEPPLAWLEWWPLTPDPRSPESSSAEPGAASLAPGEGETAAQFAERFTRTMVGDRRYERLTPATRLGLGDDGPVAVAELSELPLTPAFDPRSVRVPVVVARGAHAARRHRRGTDWLAVAIPGAELATIGGADHGVHISHPRELAQLLEQLALQVEKDASRAPGAQEG